MIIRSSQIFYSHNPSFDNKSMNSFHEFKHLIPNLYTPPLWGGLVKEKNLIEKKSFQGSQGVYSIQGPTLFTHISQALLI